MRARVVDAAVLAWAVASIVLGTALALEVRRLTELSDTAVVAGTALHSTADALGALEAVPLIGTSLEPLERRIRTASERARAGGVESRTAIRRASILVWVAVVTGPTAPVLFVYLPQRRAWRHERRFVRGELRRHGLDPRCARTSRVAPLRDRAWSCWRPAEAAAASTARRSRVSSSLGLGCASRRNRKTTR